MNMITRQNNSIILLDERTFRDDIKPYEGEYKNDRRYFYTWIIHAVQAKLQCLVKKNGNGLKRNLKNMQVRIIGSGTQFGIEFNGYESWANFPNEQLKFLNLIKKTRANGVLFISGDVHYAEISKLEIENLYPIYDITASGLSSTWHFATPNKYRIEGPIMENHFGLLSIKFGSVTPSIKAEIWDINDNQRIEYTIYLEELIFDK